MVPSWIDPADPAHIEAKCLDYTAALEAQFNQEDPNGTLSDPTVMIDYEDVEFDVLPGGRTDQTVRVDPVERRIGQSSRVQATGCDLPDAAYFRAIAYPGSDPSGLGAINPTGPGVFADRELADGALSVDLTLSDSAYGYWVSTSGSDADEEITDLNAYEIPTSLTSGPWTVIPICSSEGGLMQLFEAQVITVNGTAPIDDIDLTPVVANTRNLVLAGDSCTAGRIRVTIRDIAGADLTSVWPDDEVELEQARRRAALANPLRRSSQRAIISNEEVDRSIELDANADGSWSVPIEAQYDQGFVIAETTCGDPLADGWTYDVQSATVKIAPTSVLTPTTVPNVSPVAPPPPAPGPAIARPGRPAYAG